MISHSPIPAGQKTSLLLDSSWQEGQTYAATRYGSSWRVPLSGSGPAQPGNNKIGRKYLIAILTAVVNTLIGLRFDMLLQITK
jgi:hypothetical protein